MEGIGSLAREEIKANEISHGLSLNFPLLLPARFQVPSRDLLIRLPTRPVYLRTRWVNGDGNCMFAAFANAMGDIGTTHKTVRREAIKWARRNINVIEPFVDDDNGVNGYLRNMARLVEWGDHIMLDALCQAYSVAVAVLKKAEDGSLVWLKVGRMEPDTRFLGLYLESEHYENLVTLDDVYGR